jgi:hypothetical protein
MVVEVGSLEDSSRHIVEKAYNSKVPELPSYYNCGNSELQDSINLFHYFTKCYQTICVYNKISTFRIHFSVSFPNVDLHFRDQNNVHLHQWYHYR